LATRLLLSIISFTPHVSRANPLSPDIATVFGDLCQRVCGGG
jgi:hypothetical protein